MDNRDNSQPDDAVPEGDVEVEVKYSIEHKYDYYPSLFLTRELLLTL
ncbi:MAG: hypothetical protein QME47_00725 [Candidatus Thermoplasmatota archaeon]|nr:hypothetical protein [Candidatus Thermoplasmatota archaeon]